MILIYLFKSFQDIIIKCVFQFFLILILFKKFENFKNKKFKI